MKCHNPYCHNIAIKKITVRLPDGSSVFEMNFCKECAKEIEKGIISEFHRKNIIKTNSLISKEQKKEWGKKGGLKKAENFNLKKKCSC